MIHNNSFNCRPSKHTGLHLDEWVHKCSKNCHIMTFSPPEVTAPVCFRGRTPSPGGNIRSSNLKDTSWLAKGRRDCRNSSVEEYYDLNISIKTCKKSSTLIATLWRLRVLSRPGMGLLLLTLWFMTETLGKSQAYCKHKYNEYFSHI